MTIVPSLLQFLSIITLIITSVVTLFIFSIVMGYLKQKKKLSSFPGITQLLPPLVAKYIPESLYPNAYREQNSILWKGVLECFDKTNSPIIKLIIADRGFIIINDAEFSKVIATKGQKVFVRPKGTFELDRELLGNNLFHENEKQEWLRQRLLMNPAFTDQSMRCVVESTRSVTKSYIEVIERSFNEQNHRVRNVSSDMSNISLDVIGLAGYGYDFESVKSYESNIYSDAVQTSFEYTEYSRILPIPVTKNLRIGFLKKLHESIEVVQKEARRLIEVRKQELMNGDVNHSKGRDLLSLLVEGSNQSGNDENHNLKPLSDRELVANAHVFLVAGHETTARSLVFILYLLALHPEIQKKAQNFVDKLGNNCPSFEQILESGEEIQYIKAIIKESLRLYPIAIGILRETTQDIKFKEYNIPKGSNVFVAFHKIHRDPKNWESPEEFKPERFIQNSEQKSGSTFLHTPFGVGDRSCIGRKFSEYEMIVVLSMLLKRYNMCLQDPNYKMELEVVVTLRPKQDILIRFEPR